MNNPTTQLREYRKPITTWIEEIVNIMSVPLARLETVADLLRQLDEQKIQSALGLSLILEDVLNDLAE